MRHFMMVGGPLDGLKMPDAHGFFGEGDRLAVDTKRLAKPDSLWSPQSVYRVQGLKLIYDPDATNRRRRADCRA